MKNLLLNIQKYVKIGKTFSTISQKNEKRICVIGAGPAGFYATQYITKHLPNSCVDIIERLPVPFGLVRFGVAPDHQEVKNVINTFTKTAENPNVRYFGNVSLGKDFSLNELRERYHAVLLSYGAEKDKKLGIPNEDKYTNILSAREFVAWYNGLPGTENFNPNLSGDTIAIIGQGNVAIDVARILLSSIDVLSKTDITKHSLEHLCNSRIKYVNLIGRRGPLQAAFTIKELREMTKLPNVRTVWRSDDFIGIADQLTNLPRPRKRITELMLTNLAASQSIVGDGVREFRPIFLRSPKSIDMQTGTMELIVNQLDSDRAVPTQNIETIKANLILRSIGYKSISMDKDLNFNDRQGLVHNVGGRVLRKQPNDGNKFENGLYVSGWLATGPTGVILTTMNNAFSVAKQICDDFKSGAIDINAKKPGLEANDLKNCVTWNGWERIDYAEITAGNGIKPREKIVDIKRMLEIALN